MFRHEEDAREAAKKIAEATEKKDSTNNDKLLPIGEGAFGDVYDNFRGKAKAAFTFLMSNKSGDLLGVFHREDIGDVDVVWGDNNGGLNHIINKHVGDGKSFSNIDDAASVIDNIIKKGTKDFENGDKIVLKLGCKHVIIRKNIRDNGKKIADKNWVLTAYDELSADGDVSAIAPINQGQAARTTDNSRDKDTEKFTSNQTTSGDTKDGELNVSDNEQDKTNVEPKNKQKNGLLRNDDAVRTKGLQAENSEVGKGGGRGSHNEEVWQEGGRTNGRTENGNEGTGGEVQKGNGRSSGRLQGLTEPKNTHNNHSERGVDHAPKSVNARIEANINAIELARELLESGEIATPEQMSVLRKFSGWGRLGTVFSNLGY